MPGGSYPPPEVIASWPKPNYVNPQTRGPALYITCTTLSVIGVIVVAARLYARLVITKAPGVDDVIIVVALLLAIGAAVLFIWSTQVLYVGHHIWDIPPSAFEAIRLNSWLGQWFVTASLAAVKISLLLFYRRLSVTFSNLFLWATWIGIGYNIVYFIVVALSISFECRPTAAYWLATSPKWLAEGHPFTCSHIEGIILPLYSAASVVGDFYSTTLPLCLVYSLKMSGRQKTSLYCLFGVGYTVVAAGIARTVFVNKVVNQTYDTTWTYYDALLWVIVEMFVAIICASAPGLKPFIKKFLVEPITQNTSLGNKRRSGYTFGSAGRNRGNTGNPSDTYLNETNNDEEAWAREGEVVELGDYDKQEEDNKIGVIVREKIDSFNDRPHHSLVPDESSTGLEHHSRTQRSSTSGRYEQYQRAQQIPNKQYEHQHMRTPSHSSAHNTADRSSHNSEEPILEAPQILDNRAYSNESQVVPFSIRVPPPIPVMRILTPSTRDPSFVTFSAFPLPQPRAASRVSETDEHISADRDIDFELPLQGTRENSPVDMRPMRAAHNYPPSKSRASELLAGIFERHRKDEESDDQ